MVLVCRSVFYEDVDAFGEETEGEKKATEELQFVMMFEYKKTIKRMNHVVIPAIVKIYVKRKAMC